MNYINIEETIGSENFIKEKVVLDKEKSKKMTGYASIDKPWLKYYSRDIIESPLPNKTIYRYIYEKNKEYLDRCALNYYSNKISYRTMFKNIDMVAEQLKNFGVKQGDVVTICMPTLPETVYLFYALNKIGAVSNMIDPRKSTEEIVEYSNIVKSKLLFIVSVAESKVYGIKNKTSIEKIVTISPSESLPLYLNYPLKIKKLIKQKTNKSKHLKSINEFISWKSFLAHNKHYGLEIDAEYIKNSPVTIVYTGGTTGLSKGVILSNDNINAAAYQCEISGFDFQRQHKWLNVMPPFIAYGVGNGLHLPLSCGMEVILVPQFNPKEFDKLLMKYKPNHMTGVPTHYDTLLTSKTLKSKSLSFIYSAIVGGDKLQEKSEVLINNYLDEHNCNYKIAKGYGLSEVMAAVCATSKNKYNSVGSVGIPFSHTTISIFDFENGSELKYNEIGEVCITGPNTMIGYYNNQVETDNIIRNHADGKKWVHSGDIGYIDSDGKIYIIGRKKEMIIRHDGFKVYPTLIEKIIMKHPAVEECKVVGILDKNYSQGELPKAHIVLKEEYKLRQNEVLNEIKNMCNRNLAEYLIPVEYKFRDELPKTPIGKIDFMQLKSEESNELKETKLKKTKNYR